MDIATAKQQIKYAVKAYLHRNDAGMHSIAQVHQRPIFLMGAPGIGKTAIIEQIAQELQIGMVSYSMTHHTRQSALGLPQIVHREFGSREYDVSEYTMSEIIGAVYDYADTTGEQQGILFLDEVNCVSETLYPSMLQFLQFKKFGQHALPDDWVIVCAGNPPEYNRSVHDFDIVTLDRLREIDVEPDYAVWSRYATEKGLHPAVTTFLQAKPDCFYKVESKPGGGKHFVTARGWEDLAEVIALYEEIDAPRDDVLFAQFLRDEDIASQFSVYYRLFEKYRSDYQIGNILGGTASPEVIDRAKQAELDERVALLGLILDALSAQCAKTLDQEQLALSLRDELRLAKPKLLGGAAVEEALMSPLREREAELGRKTAAGTVTQAFVRGEQLFARKMREIANACVAKHTEEGPEAFETVNTTYRIEVDAIGPLVAQAQDEIENAIEFIEMCFGDNREMLMFLAELSTRTATAQFISHYGSDAYYKRSDELKVDDARERLTAHVRELGDIMDEIERSQLLETNSLDMGSGAGLGLTDTDAKPQPEKNGNKES